MRKQELYDLWENSGSQLQSDRLDGIKQSSKRNKSSKYISSLIPAVVPPDEGASYNPPMSSYLNFVNKIAKEEDRLMARERRMERKLLPATDETGNTILTGLKEDDWFFMNNNSLCQPKVDNENDEVMELISSNSDHQSDDKKSKTQTKIVKANQKRQKQRIIEQKCREKQKKMMKQQLQSLKSLNRTVKTELQIRDETVKRRHLRNILKKLTRRKRLGRGTFEAFQQPVLTVQELPFSLRQLNPHGESVLQERIKSMQHRNILPIGGEKNSKRLKRRLKVKFVEKRNVAGKVTSDSKVT